MLKNNQHAINTNKKDILFNIVSDDKNPPNKVGEGTCDWAKSEKKRKMLSVGDQRQAMH